MGFNSNRGLMVQATGKPFISFHSLDQHPLGIDEEIETSRRILLVTGQQLNSHQLPILDRDAIQLRRSERTSISRTKMLEWLVRESQ